LVSGHAGTEDMGRSGQKRGLPVQPADQLVDVGLARSYGADEVGRLVASGLGMGHRDGLLLSRRGIPLPVWHEVCCIDQCQRPPATVCP
jgi:hypothetical protein